MSITYEIGYETGSGNVMPMSIHGHYMRRSDIPVRNNPGELCHNKIDCSGKDGGCPPFAPLFNKIKPSRKHIFVVITEFDLANSLQYSVWDRSFSAPGHFILVYANRLTDFYSKRMVKYFRALGYYTLGLGNCGACNHSSCTVLKGEKCKKPSKRSYSMEAVGVACGTLHKRIFGEVLPWWFRTPKHIPTRMWRYIGILTNKPPRVMEEILWEFIEADKSYTTKDMDFSSNYDTCELLVPNGSVSEGEPYSAYRIPIED